MTGKRGNLPYEKSQRWRFSRVSHRRSEDRGRLPGRRPGTCPQHFEQGARGDSVCLASGGPRGHQLSDSDLQIQRTAAGPTCLSKVLRDKDGAPSKVVNLVHEIPHRISDVSYKDQTRLRSHHTAGRKHSQEIGRQGRDGAGFGYAHHGGRLCK